jgi:adenine phosphoribosyltransferase
MNSTDLKNSIRTVPDFPVEGIQFRDITSLLENPDAFNDAIVSMMQVLGKEINVNAIVGIESRGFIFGSPLAWDMGIPLILARKPGKLPNDSYKKDYKLEYGSATIEIQKNSAMPDSGILIIDDLIATGGTALACADLIHENWGIPKDQISVLAVIDLPDLKGSEKIQSNGYNCYTLLEFNGE